MSRGSFIRIVRFLITWKICIQIDVSRCVCGVAYTGTHMWSEDNLQDSVGSLPWFWGIKIRSQISAAKNLTNWTVLLTHSILFEKQKNLKQITKCLQHLEEKKLKFPKSSCTVPLFSSASFLYLASPPSHPDSTSWWRGTWLSSLNVVPQPMGLWLSLLQWSCTYQKHQS